MHTEFLIVKPHDDSWLPAVKAHAARRKHAKDKQRRIKEWHESLACYENESLQLIGFGLPKLHNGKTSISSRVTSLNDPDDIKDVDHLALSKDLRSCEFTTEMKPTLNYQPEGTLLGHLLPGRPADKDDVMRYLAFFPSMAMGASLDNKFQPIRDICICGIQTTSSAVDWLLLETDAIRSAENPTVITAMYARRQRIYRRMNKLLSHPVLRRSDELLAMSLAATCIEYRTTNGMDLERVRIHYRGLERLIEIRGGLSSLMGQGPVLSRPINYLNYLSAAELEVSNSAEAQSCCQSILNILQQVQVFTERTGKCMIASYYKPLSSLRYLTHPNYSAQVEEAKIPRFLSMYLIVLIIRDFGTHNEIAAKFLFKITALIENRINSITGATQLSPHILTWIVTSAWVDVDLSSTWHGSGPEKELWITQSGVEALKVFGRISDRSKTDLTNLLTNWICAGCNDPGHPLDRDWNQEELSTLMKDLRAECCSDLYEQRITLEKENMVGYSNIYA